MTNFVRKTREIFGKIILCARERRLPWKLESLLREIRPKISFQLAVFQQIYRLFVYKRISGNREKYLAYFDKSYQKKLTESTVFPAGLRTRHAGFRKIFEELLDQKKKRKEDFVIVETGTLRQDEQWRDGQSSLLFYEFLNIFGGTLISIDINGENIKSCKRILMRRVPRSGKAKLVLITGDSIEELSKIGGNVDLLYLDSYDLDFNNPQPSMMHHLKELISVQKMISGNKDLLIATDDNYESVGKGRYVMDWAKKTNQEILFDNFQTIIKVRYPEGLLSIKL